MCAASTAKHAATPCPDHILVERAKARDGFAFGELICRHDRNLRSLVSRFVDTPSDQEDVLQNALLNAWRYLPAFEGRSKFSSWMYRVTANSALMLLRGGVRRQEALVGDVEDALATAELGGAAYCESTSCWIEQPDEALQCSELRELLEHLVASLPERLREAFILRYVEGLSIKETAKALGLKEPATKTRIHRACLALREAIHRRASDVVFCRNRESPSRQHQTTVVPWARGELGAAPAMAGPPVDTEGASGPQGVIHAAAEEP